jgi:hypothetical protein
MDNSKTKYSYFYRLGDDIQLMDKWAKPFVGMLSSFGEPYYGVVGPKCDEGCYIHLLINFKL